ncbi:MAG: hypothetical protein Q4A52_04415 [Bacillota bacterium]|nr:hypothetical protein [Bacillota bacterium]
MIEQYKISTPELLEELEELIQSRMGIPFLGRVFVKRDQVIELIDAIRSSLPADLDKARHIVENQIRLESGSKKAVEELHRSAQEQSDDIIRKAQQKANEILNEAKTRAGEMVANHEIVRRAQQSAEEMRAQAISDAQYRLIQSLQQSKETLFATESELINLLNELQNRRRRIEADLVARNKK